jgi:regulator of replication initiation timing
VPDYMRIKEIFSFENFARMHREIEQLKDVVRELHHIHVPSLQAENSDLKEKIAEMEIKIIKFIEEKK